MAKSNTVTVRAKLESATPDRTQYKPYAPTLSFENVYVDIPIPSENVIEEKGGKLVLDVNGMAIALDIVATAVDEMNERWTLSKSKPFQHHKPF